MIVNFEFFGKEPIENVITCMHFKIDKVVFFGAYDLIQKRKKCTEEFLRDHCSVQNVVFHVLSENDLHSVTDIMRREIQHELARGNQIFADITGGESIMLVAFGMLSKEFGLPLHMFDIKKNKLVELDSGAARNISSSAEKQTIELDLDKYLQLKDCVINYRAQKALKTGGDSGFASIVSDIWAVAKKNLEQWNRFSELLRTNMNTDGSLSVNSTEAYLRAILHGTDPGMDTVDEVCGILRDLAERSLISDFRRADGSISFRYKNKSVKDCLWEGGSILELQTYCRQKEKSSDCRIGVHLDWDGILHPDPGADVVNEIDVLALDGINPVFISCKSGEMKPSQTLKALYELETVAKRFGGKYARKVLVTTRKLSKMYMERAQIMGIEVWQEN